MKEVSEGRSDKQSFQQILLSRENWLIELNELLPVVNEMREGRSSSLSFILSNYFLM